MTARQVTWHGSNWIRKSKRQRIYERDGGKCLYCGALDTLSLDHFIPVSKGGTNDAGNLFTACIPCNSGRGNKPVKSYCTSVEVYQGILNARARKL
jgi:5-methylcytosine-specific restriction endonuclease McrA